MSPRAPTRACESRTVHPQFCQNCSWGTDDHFHSRIFQSGLLLATALSVAAGPAVAQGYTPEQEQACTGDAFQKAEDDLTAGTICGSEVPDLPRGRVPLAGGRSDEHLRRDEERVQ